MSSPCQKRSSISPNPFTPSLPSGLLLLSLFYIRYFTFTSQLTITVSHTGLGLRQNSQRNHNCLAHRFLDRFIIYEQTGTYFFTTLLVFFMFCTFASTPSFKAAPPHLAASACSFEVSLDVCQTPQDFVMSPNSISTFCSHSISGMHVRVQTGLPTEQKCQGQRRDQSLSQPNTIRGPPHTPRPSHPHVGAPVTPQDT